MPEFSIHLTETRHFVIPVTAATSAKACEAAQALWRDAPTTAQWEIPDTDTDIVSVLEKP